MFIPLTQIYSLSIFLFFFSFFLDITFSLSSTIHYMKNNTELYIENLHANLQNLFVISPIYYLFSYYLLLNNQSNIISPLNISIILFFQNIFYHLIHQYMHIGFKYLPNIKYIHDFHHKFTITTPTIGNAVSNQEYQLAYILPFLIGIYIVNPSPYDLQISVLIISILNMTIHSNELKFLNYYPFLISPNKHITHHETKQNCYSAPILDIDFIIKYFKNKFN